MGLIDQMMANLYKPPKQEKPNTILPKALTPAKVANMMNQTTVSHGQILKGQVLDLRANQIMVLLENGTTVSARTEGTLELSIGQHAKFFAAQTSEDQILLKLEKEDSPSGNPMIDRALSAANIQKTERSISIVTELLNHQQPVNETGIRHYLSLSAKYPELPVKALILMELHHIPVTKENAEQFIAYQDRNAKLLTQVQDMLQSLTDTISQMPEGVAKQEVLTELQQVFKTMTRENPSTTPVVTAPNSETPFPEDFSVPSDPALPDTDLSNTKLPDSSLQTVSEKESAPVLRDTPVETELLLKDFLTSFLLEPEEVADPENVQKYYEELSKKLETLEQLSKKVAEQTAEETASATPKQLRQNLSFMEAVNNVFPYVQLPLKFKETPAHGELYVYEKKKALQPSDSLSALLHLELEALGVMDIFITLAGTHVTTRFSMSDKESGNLIQTELPKLTEALALKGYTLQSEVTVKEPETENTPTLLEQFLEEHAPGGLNRYTFDIRA